MKNYMKNHIYLLITPVKNEEESLNRVADSVIKQTIKPELWIIVDDGSTDKTPLIIKELVNKCTWIKVITLQQGARDITYHYSYVCKQGFDFALKYSANNNIDYEYIALLDADTLLVENYFEHIILKFEEDSNLGIASGSICYNHTCKLEIETSSENLPRGTGRMWRRKCFFDTGGYIIEPSPDSISNVKALKRGWKIRRFKDIMSIQTRYTSSAEGLWNGYKIKGNVSYYLNKHPLLIILNTSYFLIKTPYYIGVAYLFGYLESLFKRKIKIEDKEIREYYWNERIREYKLMLVARIKNICMCLAGKTKR